MLRLTTEIATWAVRINYTRVTTGRCSTLRTMQSQIRHATAADLTRINEIYNNYIVDRHTSFDHEPWPIEDRVEWFEKYAEEGRYQVLVSAVDDVIAGFASSSRFRGKAAYDTSVESTIVLDEPFIGRGLGEPLLTCLLAQLGREDVHRVYGLIALPNDPSIKLHERLGYRRVGVLDQVGRKLGTYHSVMIMELAL